jgi:hypothetical protein
MVAVGFSLRKWRNLKVAATSAVETLIGNRFTSHVRANVSSSSLPPTQLIAMAEGLAMVRDDNRCFLIPGNIIQGPFLFLPNHRISHAIASKVLREYSGFGHRPPSLKTEA